MPENEKLVERLRAHVIQRGGPAKDGSGQPVMPNGAWQMMLEAAAALTAAEARIKMLEAERKAFSRLKITAPAHISDAHSSGFWEGVSAYRQALTGASDAG